jgi:hypothetical protein
MRPPAINRGTITRVATELSATRKDVDRAMPDSKGSETPKQLQTYRTEIYSYFTESTSETQLLYSAENWVKIKLALQTAGPVAVGTVASLAPALSGRGILLDPDVPFEAFLAKGTRFYITSETVNRVNVTIEPVPWLEQIDEDSVNAQNGVRKAVMDIGHSIVNAVNALRGAGQTTSSSGRTAAQMSPAPQGDRRVIPRLTGMTPPKNIR